MMDQNSAGAAVQPTGLNATAVTSRPRLTPTERRAAHYAEIAGQQANLKREAAQRRAAREARAGGTNEGA